MEPTKTELATAEINTIVLGDTKIDRAVGTLKIWSLVEEGKRPQINASLDWKKGTAEEYIKYLNEKLPADRQIQSLNWFQYVGFTKVPDKFPYPANKKMIDPPKGCTAEQWADDEPWYYDVKEPPADNKKRWAKELLIQSHIDKTVISYSDAPSFPNGTEATFATFLVGVTKDPSKSVFLAGFSWTFEATAGAVEGTTDSKIGYVGRIENFPPEAFVKTLIENFNK